MTEHKSFKRLVRGRMAKTGESYTAARAQLLAGTEVPTVDSDVLQFPCSEERLREQTGRGWEEWFDLLDSWGAESLGHTEIARRVGELPGVPGWYAQAVTMSFERARGLRAVGQRTGREGFVAGVSKTIAASAEDVFAAFVDPSQRAGWLPDIVPSERTVAKPSRTARYDVGDGPTRLMVTVDAKGPKKATLVVEESRLAGAEQREVRKDFWRQAVATFKMELETQARARYEAERIGREPQPKSPRFGGPAAARQRGLQATQHGNTGPRD
jgi:hypothetical protein